MRKRRFAEVETRHAASPIIPTFPNLEGDPMHQRRGRTEWRDFQSTCAARRKEAFQSCHVERRAARGTAARSRNIPRMSIRKMLGTGSSPRILSCSYYVGLGRDLSPLSHRVDCKTATQLRLLARKNADVETRHAASPITQSFIISGRPMHQRRRRDMS